MLKARKPGSPRGGSGELAIDNRAAPVPLVQRCGDGATLTVPAGGFVELKTLTCTHCGTVVVLNPARARPRASCGRCNYYVCDRCAATGFCTFVEDLVDLALARPGLDALGRRFDWQLLAERRPH